MVSLPLPLPQFGHAMLPVSQLAAVHGTAIVLIDGGNTNFANKEVNIIGFSLS
jgi:hypothetical protein